MAQASNTNSFSFSEVDETETSINPYRNVQHELQNERAKQEGDKSDHKLRANETFDEFDSNKDGVLDRTELRNLLKTNREKLGDNAKAVTEIIIKKYDVNNDGHLDRHEFEEVVRNHKWIVNRYVERYCEIVAPMVKQRIQDEMKLCPPPLGIIIISVIQLVCFILHQSETGQPTGESNSTITGFSQQNLLYSPHHREQVWRFFSYMFVHANVLHIASNLFIQIFLGIPLEYVHTWWRVMIVYLAGVLSGSLGASIVNADHYLVGASAGGYALLFAFIPTFLLNWREMKDRVLYFTMFAVCFTFITLPALLSSGDKISHVAHGCGAVAGILVGMVVLKNIKVEPIEQKLQLLAKLLFCSFIVAAIVIHVFVPSHFPESI